MSRKKPQKKSEADDIRELRKLAAKAEAEGEDKVAVREEKTPSTPQPAEAHQEVPETDFAKQAQVRAVEEAQINFNAEQAKLVADSAAELHKRIIARTNAAANPLTALQLEMATLIADREALAMRDRLWQEKYTRCANVRIRLEKLCRDLETQMRAIAAQREADIAEVTRNLNEKHVGQLKHSQEVIERVIEQMNSTAAENERVAKENQELRAQYNKLYEILKSRDEHFENLEKLTKARDEALEAKINNQNNVVQEQQKLLKETMGRLKNATERENILKKQVEAYSKQISEAQSVLKQSAEAINQMKRERADIEARLLATQKTAVSAQEESTKYLRELAASTTLIAELREKNQKLSALCTKLLEKQKQSGDNSSGAKAGDAGSAAAAPEQASESAPGPVSSEETQVQPEPQQLTPESVQLDVVPVTSE